MATVYKRPDSEFWYAKYFGPDGKRLSKNTGATKKREAQKIAEDFESEGRDIRRKAKGLPKAFAAVVEAAAREAAEGNLTLARAQDLIMKLHKYANPDFRVVSLSDHVMGWIRNQKHHVELSTTEVYMDMHRHMTGALGKRVSSAPVGDLTVDQVNKAIQKLKDGGLRGSTVNLALRSFRRALHAAVAAGLARANVAQGIRPLPEDDSVERAPFEPEEVRRMISHPQTSDEWKGVILFGGSTGLRLGDVAKLGSGHVADKRLVIRPKKTKRRKNASTIVIPLSPGCLAWIEGKNGDFFPNLSKRVTGTLSTTFKRIMKSAGVPDKVTLPGGIEARRSFHSLRHSFTSWLADADVAADVRQKLTGHKSAGIHANYTHHDEALDRAIQSLPYFSMKPLNPAG